MVCRSAEFVFAHISLSSQENELFSRNKKNNKNKKKDKKKVWQEVLDGLEIRNSLSILLEVLWWFANCLRFYGTYFSTKCFHET